jgi:hypothetical protein
MSIIKFNIEKAEVLDQSLKELFLFLEEWSIVEAQLETLGSTWKDEQFYEFSALFTELSGTYNQAHSACEYFRGSLRFAITEAEKNKFNVFRALEKPLAAVEIFTGLLAMQVAPPTNPLVDQYNSMPAVARVVELKDQLQASLQKSSEKDDARKKEAANISSTESNSSKASGSPDVD